MKGQLFRLFEKSNFEQGENHFSIIAQSPNKVVWGGFFIKK